MGSSSKSNYQPPANQAPPGDFHATPGGEPPPWNSILPTGNGPAQLGDKMRSEPLAPPSLAPAASASASPPAGAATSAASKPSLPPELATAGPDVQQQYLAAKAAGDDTLAARILLAAKMLSPVQMGQDRGDRGGEHASGGSLMGGYGSGGWGF